MNEKQYNCMRDKFYLVTSSEYKKIRQEQLEMIIDMAKTEIDPLEIKAMLRLIAKTDRWEEEFEKIDKNKRK